MSIRLAPAKIQQWSNYFGLYDVVRFDTFWLDK
jgi:hypothetical protein